MLTGSQIRRKFLDFFIEKGHREVHSSSLVPANDPTLLFTNAGMNQFKDVFLGLEKRDYNRATTSQKCVRAGGKHNDLENVGFTNRHHTFFEMLGNFSFGDYFKKDAIAYAWELITSPKWFGIPKDKLYVTVFEQSEISPGQVIPGDHDALMYWSNDATGLLPDRIRLFGPETNFWAMGDTGPCGPCSEIHYDMGPAASDQGHTDCQFGCECGRYVEIWNLVFMQFDRDASGKLTPLPKPSIDTGMGLERLAAVLQGVISNYDTDLFTPLIKRAAELVGMSQENYLVELGKEFHEKGGAASLRVVADHSRAATFLISDGVIPSNEGRGYVLRKIIRRAITHGRLLGQTKPFLSQMAFSVRDLMQDAYPELVESVDRVSKVLLAEEERFGHTLRIGLDGLREALRAENPIRESEVREFSQQNAGAGPSEWQRRFPGRRRGFDGHVAFHFTSTFGMPRDFIVDFLRDNDVALDDLGYEEALAEEQARARASWKGAVKQTANPAYQRLPKSEFEGYRQTRSENCEVLAIIHNGKGVQQLEAGYQGEIVLDHTPFYAESGGQVGDRGWLTNPERRGGFQLGAFQSPGFQTSQVVAEVTGCYYPIQGVRAHQVVAKQPIRVGDKVEAVVNTDLRSATMRNHTATHLLHAGLREVLGKHVKQAGSLVAPNHLRFDFSHFTGVEDEEVQDIEDIINKEVLHNEKIEVIENVPIDVAVNEYHAMALFGEKYGDKVRVIKIGDFSTELCGGTHTAQTGEIGLIKILKEGSVSSGVRRIEAVTGEGSLRHFRKDHELEKVVAGFAGPTLAKPTLAQRTRKDGAPTASDGAPEAESPAKALKTEIDRRDAEIKRLQKELDQVRMKSASSGAANIADKIKDVRGIKVLAHRADNLERPQLRTLVDQLREKLGSGVVVIGSSTNGDVSLIAGVTKDLTSRVQAGKIVGKVAEKVGGKGGGRPDLAEAGGKDAGALDSALDEVYKVVESLLG